MDDLKHLIEIPESEADTFKEMIRDYRKKLIKPPVKMVEGVFEKEKVLIADIKTSHNLSEAIHCLREKTYTDFLYEESAFNVRLLKDIGKKLDTPKQILATIIDGMIDLSADNEKVIERIKIVCGEYSGRISPYIYQLSLSNTQSRRSRAGKTFEAIIYKMYEVLGFSYVSQGKVGKTAFQDHGLGKMVDSLLPSIEAFSQRRDKVIIGTMKTTLRERWQEVIEEISRTGLPKIYLLTMDDNISVSKATQMGKHNVVIVVPKSVKKSGRLAEMRNIISFEDYFLGEIPETLKYWD